MTPHAQVQAHCSRCQGTLPAGAAHCGMCGAPQVQHAQPAQGWQQPPAQGWQQPPVQGGAHPPAQGWQQPAAQGWQQSVPGFAGGISRKKIVGGIAGAIVIAALGVGGTIVKNKYMGPKGKTVASWSKLGIDGGKANPDELIGAVSGMARKWKKDAAWWSINVMGVRPDGTVDLKNGGIAKVEYISPSGVASKAKSRRKDSVKEFNFNARGVKADKIIGARKPWENVVLPSAPTCTVAELVATLRDRGFADGTVRISFNPSTAFASGGYHWRVWSDAAPLAGFYSMDDCSFVKAASGG
jgi:hypothetical protein